MDSDANYSAQAGAMYVEILDALIVDVAAEVHRAAKLGFDQRMNVDEEEELRLSVQARASASAGENGEAANGGGSKYVVDVFGQSHPAVASELFDCMNCGRPIMAGRFAPHLEKCMGKGRKARLKSTRSSQQQQQQQQQRKPRSMYVEDDE